MAREIEFSKDDYSGSNPLYAVAYSVTTGLYVIGTSLEAYNAAHWTSYANALAFDSTTNLYYTNFPAVANDDYDVRIFEQLGAFPATSDAAGDPLAEGIFTWTGSASVTIPSQFDVDSNVFFNVAEFAEMITYNVYGGSSVRFAAIVDRNPPQRMHEDNHSLTNYIEVEFPNNASNGVTTIQTNKDTITLVPKFGGAVRECVITKIIKQDAGAWLVAVR